MDQERDFTREPVGRFDWERILRRVQVSAPSVKLVGFAMATYADADGGRVRPGQRRLAAVTGTSESTVRRGQSELVDIGMLDMITKGRSVGRGHASGFASEYRLTLPSDLLENVPMLDPDEQNHQSPMTGPNTSYQPPTTGSSSELPVKRQELPVTSEELPVKWAELPVTHDSPPDHLHQNKDQYKNHQSGYITKGDAHASDERTDDKEFDHYQAASEYLQRLPDLGQAHLGHVTANFPEQHIIGRVIMAAERAGWNPPEARAS